jgi:hypothetical protein
MFGIAKKLLGKLLGRENSSSINSREELLGDCKNKKLLSKKYWEMWQR